MSQRKFLLLCFSFVLVAGFLQSIRYSMGEANLLHQASLHSASETGTSEADVEHLSASGHEIHFPIENHQSVEQVSSGSNQYYNLLRILVRQLIQSELALSVFHSQDTAFFKPLKANLWSPSIPIAQRKLLI